jgi:hypothetical protein
MTAVSGTFMNKGKGQALEAIKEKSETALLYVLSLQVPFPPKLTFCQLSIGIQRKR